MTHKTETLFSGLVDAARSTGLSMLRQLSEEDRRQLAVVLTRAMGEMIEKSSVYKDGGPPPDGAIMEPDMLVHIIGFAILGVCLGIDEIEEDTPDPLRN